VGRQALARALAFAAALIMRARWPRIFALLLVLGLTAGLPAASAPRQDESFQHGTVGSRTYRLFVPNQPPRALVVALHGCWQTAEDFAAGTRLNEMAERRALLVVYPIQTPRDNPSRCWNWFLPAHQSRTRGELAEVLAVADEVGWRHSVRDRPFLAVGFSAGAFMTVNLACVAPDRLAGVGVASGGPYRCGVGIEGGLQCMRGYRVDGGESAAACRKAAGGHRLPRASLWHGELDSVVEPRDLVALAQMFSLLLGAGVGRTTHRDGAARSVWTDSQGREALEAWLVAGMGHAWSGGSVRATHTFPSGPDATEQMLDFLLQ